MLTQAGAVGVIFLQTNFSVKNLNKHFACEDDLPSRPVLSEETSCLFCNRAVLATCSSATLDSTLQIICIWKRGEIPQTCGICCQQRNLINIGSRRHKKLFHWSVEKKHEHQLQHDNIFFYLTSSVRIPWSSEGKNEMSINLLHQTNAPYNNLYKTLR